MELTLENVKHLASLIVPKLRGLENSGDGATIHHARSGISVIEGSILNAEYYYKTENRAKELECLTIAKQGIDDAEKFLTELAIGQFRKDLE